MQAIILTFIKSSCWKESRCNRERMITQEEKELQDEIQNKRDAVERYARAILQWRESIADAEMEIYQLNKESVILRKKLSELEKG